MRRRQAGVTLIEITIILVIVGILLGGTLMAHEVVNSAKVKNLANDFRTLPTGVYAYQEMRRALPGDDSRVSTRWAAAVVATTPAGRQGNGVIDGAWNSTTTTDESRLLWQHLRMAELLSGATDPDDPLYTPRNAMGGVIGISGMLPAQRQVAGMTGDYQICSSGIPGKFARQLDLIIDDGDTAKGGVRLVADGAALGSPAVPLASVDNQQPYTVCMVF